MFHHSHQGHRLDWTQGLLPALWCPLYISSVQFSLSVMSNSLLYHGVQLARFPCLSSTPGACSNSIPSSWIPSNQLILCCLLLLLSIFPSIGVFSNELALHIRWPKYWSFSIILPMNLQGWFLFGLTDLISLPSKGFSRVFSNTTVQKHQFFSGQPSLQFNSHIHIWLLEKP